MAVAALQGEPRQGWRDCALEAYGKGVEFEWDEDKSDTTERERGFGFAFAGRIFLGPTVSLAEQFRSGERRNVMLGEVDGLVLVVVITLRAPAWRIISARRANRKERSLWQSSVRS